MFCLCKKKTPIKNPFFEKKLETLSKTQGYGVYLNIYHLTPINYFLQFLGMGVYHSSIEVNNKEYSFFGTSDNDSGLFINTFNDTKKLLKEKIYLGNTLYDEETIRRLVVLHVPFWSGESYHIFTKNCNHFTKFFATLLLRTDEVYNYPEYVNRMTLFSTYLGGFFNPIKQLYLTKGKEKIEEDNESIVGINLNIDIELGENNKINETNNTNSSNSKENAHCLRRHESNIFANNSENLPDLERAGSLDKKIHSSTSQSISIIKKEEDEDKFSVTSNSEQLKSNNSLKINDLFKNYNNNFILDVNEDIRNNLNNTNTNNLNTNKLDYQNLTNIDIKRKSSFTEEKLKSSNNSNNSSSSNKNIIEKIQKLNFFTNLFDYKGNNNFLRNLHLAEITRVIDKDYNKSFKLYKALFNSIKVNKDKTIPEEFDNYINKYIQNCGYEINKNSKLNTDMNKYILLKIVHCLHCSSLNILEIEETIINVILKYNCDDYFSLFDLAYIKYKQKKFKEGMKILSNAKKICKYNKFLNLLNKFENYTEEEKKKTIYHEELDNEDKKEEDKK